MLLGSPDLEEKELCINGTIYSDQTGLTKLMAVMTQDALGVDRAAEFEFLQQPTSSCIQYSLLHTLLKLTFNQTVELIKCK